MCGWLSALNRQCDPLVPQPMSTETEVINVWVGWDQLLATLITYFFRRAFGDTEMGHQGSKINIFYHRDDRIRTQNACFKYVMCPREGARCEFQDTTCVVQVLLLI